MNTQQANANRYTNGFKPGRLSRFLALILLAGTARAETVTWTGDTSVDWATSGNWTNSLGTPGAPTTSDDVVIDGGARQPLLNLAGGAVTIKSLTIGQSAASTLTISNGNVSTQYLNVSGDVTIGQTGTVTHAAETSTSTALNSETQRLYLQVGGDLTIAAGGTIDVRGKGYPGDGKGPGGALANTYGGGYGGQGGGTSGGTTYGSVTNPVNNGSSGGRSGGTGGRRGGGTAVISVGGLLTLNGSILADGPVENTGEAAGAGSGGSLNIRAGSLSGNGTISAKGGTQSDGGAGGGGGRIAVVLTNADDTAFYSLAAIRAYGSPGGPGIGGGGTLYLKGTNQPYGKLIVDNNSQGTSGRSTLIQNQTLLMDTIICTNNGLLVLGSGANLNLSKGCVLLNPTNSPPLTASRFISTVTNQIIWPDTYTLSNATLSVQGTNNLLTGITNLVIASGGVLTHEQVTSTGSNPEDNLLRATILGNLTISSGGAINATGCGYTDGKGPGVGGNPYGGSHGGQGSGSASGATYDSVTNPVRSGSAGFRWSGGTGGRNGGGAVVVTVGGSLTLNGSILADGPVESTSENTYHSAGAGGSVNIVAGTLSGNGTISANGGRDAESHAGGGGRVAVVLTNDSDSAFAGLAAVRAYGGVPSSGTSIGAAGTVYLKGTNTTYGRVMVDNNSQSANLGTTLLNASTTDKTVGDVLIRNSATVVLAAGETLTSYGSWSNAVAMSTNASAAYGGTVVLAGTSPVTIWGGNTWSNLTIATAGKTVNFEAGKTQTVYGVPAFSNVTLQSTSEGAYWYLLKPGGGTQYVGRVTVQDSNATNGWTFAASGGSGRNTVNWKFPPSGSLILVW